MSFDNLITIGIIIYVIYSIKKVFSSGKKEGADKKKTSGWAGKLGDFVNEVRTEIEKANQQTTVEQPTGAEESDGDFWESIREPSPVEPQADSRRLSETLFHETKEKKLPPVVEKKLAIPEIPEESHRNYREAHAVVGLDPVKKRRHSRCLAMKKADLKKAVIWSEILSKPISLRDSD